jgi:hypothetical protein
MGIKSVLKTIAEHVLPIAPVISAGLGGPLAFAGPAIRALADKLGVDVEAPDAESQILKKIEKATPADLLAIKQADNDYALKMEQLGVDKEKIHQLDRASARERQVKTGDRFPHWLAGITVALFAVCVGFMLYHLDSPGEMNKEVVVLVSTLFGVLLASFKQVYNFYFGSSVGSQRKTEMLNGK